MGGKGEGKEQALVALIKKPLTEYPYIQVTIQTIWHGHVLDPPILPHKKV